MKVKQSKSITYHSFPLWWVCENPVKRVGNEYHRVTDRGELLIMPVDFSYWPWHRQYFKHEFWSRKGDDIAIHYDSLYPDTSEVLEVY